MDPDNFSEATYTYIGIGILSQSTEITPSNKKLMLGSGPGRLRFVISLIKSRKC